LHPDAGGLGDRRAEVKKAFTDVLVAQAMVTLASENLQTLDEIERVNRLRAEKGEIAQLELLRVQTQRFAFERDLIDGERAVRKRSAYARPWTSRTGAAA
jgi:outer membrane protein TolC